MRLFSLDLDVSIVMFWRYFWRMSVFLMLGGVVSNEAAKGWISLHHYDPAQALQAGRTFTLIFLFILLFYGVLIWAGHMITKPIKIRGEHIRMEVVQKDGQPVSTWHRAFACWWGFNWRSSLLFVLLVMVLATLPANPMAMGVVYLPLFFMIGIFSMWWWIFHPIGRVHLVLHKDPLS
ncbi:hypothetical protein H7F10_07475 [Acidithiobacillus sp. HP-6]|uniref:hypothetical protein n=1 Tax=unclassified Acidithiobacillus TaxID=2614800 RepID=UPI0018798376|nr:MULTISPECIES: hypothetical protein [unclassified Acidithiobacillus]MBE7562791.1 hypothetical protein [Acidithiobacillus sp. HP-6]MBE7568907.1 hypothetical protein [Acidithiobacillus sp. HP-2]